MIVIPDLVISVTSITCRLYMYMQDNPWNSRYDLGEKYN